MGIWADRTKNKLDTILATLVLRFAMYALVGLLIGFNPALWIVAVVCVVNFLSDLAGQYENGLYMPLSLRVLEAADREIAMAFKNTVGGILMIVFRSSGAILIGFMSYQKSCLFQRWDFLGQPCDYGRFASSVCQVVERKSYPGSWTNRNRSRTYQGNWSEPQRFLSSNSKHTCTKGIYSDHCGYQYGC